MLFRNKQSSLCPTITDFDVNLSHRGKRAQLQESGSVNTSQTETICPQLSKLLFEACFASLLQLTHNLEVAQNDLLVAFDKSFISDLTTTDTLESTREEFYQRL